MRGSGGVLAQAAISSTAVTAKMAWTEWVFLLFTWLRLGNGCSNSGSGGHLHMPLLGVRLVFGYGITHGGQRFERCADAANRWHGGQVAIESFCIIDLWQQTAIGHAG